MTERRYQVFVSSTFRDLRDERQAVLDVILALNFFPAGMELFPASNATAWEIIERCICDSDFYILIIGGMYGSIDANGISYTEREYDLARKHDKPVLPFLHKDPSQIPVAKSEQNPHARASLDRFRQRVAAQHHCKFWSTANELGVQVSIGLSRAPQDFPTLGWIRPHASSPPLLRPSNSDATDTAQDVPEQAVKTDEPGRLISGGLTSFEQTFAELCIQKQIELGRVAELLSLFSACEATTSVRPALKSVCACLSRLCGTADAIKYLSTFGPQDGEYFPIAAYERALLYYAKPTTSRRLQPPFALSDVSRGMCRLWYSLLGMAALGENDHAAVEGHYRSLEIASKQDDAFDAYSAIPVGILAAANEDAEHLTYYFDVARGINRRRRYPVHGYPYVGLIGDLDRWFVTTLVGVTDANDMSKQQIQRLRGHAHVVARHAHILRLCDRAIMTIVRVSSAWKKRSLSRNVVQQRLIAMEQRLLANAGTLFVGV